MLLTKKTTIKENTSERAYAPIVVFASSFLMYLIAILPILISRGLPFFYYGDYNVQQIPFYIVAHRAVRSGEFFWNWNIDLGGSMAGDFSFYLWGSPFFWLTVLFPENAIPYLMPLLMALKYAVASLCAYIYIRKYVKRDIHAMIGGYLFGFSGFNACNIVFNHFTDSVAFFPLYLHLFDKLMDESTVDAQGHIVFQKKNFIVFALMTSFMAIVNYYFFFGQVLFLLIYYVVKYGVKNSLRDNLILFNRALAGGIIGILIAGFFLVPAFVGVSGNTRLDNFITGYDMLVYPSEKLIWDIFKSMAMLPDIIGKGTLFYTSTVKNASLAAYIPMFGLSGVVAFMMFEDNKKSWQKRLMIICLIIALIPVFNASFSFFNSSYYARWFYMPILIMCQMTAGVLERGRTREFKKGAIFAVLFFLLFVLIYFLPSTDDSGKTVFFKMADNNTIFLRDVIGTAILCLFLVGTAFFISSKHHVITLFLVLISCVISTYIPVRNGSSIISDRGKEMWQEQMLENTVRVDMTDFCRGEVDSTSTNYDMVWGIPSIHCFLSTVPSQIFTFLEGTGDIKRTVETNIPVERAGLRAIVSAKYYFENAEISKNRTYYNGEGTDGYKYLDTQNGFDIFENINFIPMGFTYDYYITESEWSDIEPKERDYDLARLLILPDDVAMEVEKTVAMREITAEDLFEEDLSYLKFTQECEKRKETSCVSFVPDTLGFTARTSKLKDDTLVFFSVPNRKGFKCKVDGKTTPIYTADYGLMAIPVGRGEHAIRVDYRPEGLFLGVIMSACGVILLAFYAGILKNIKKND
ncbi:YfhO family protein [Butyrivibrio sp. XPD2006]|uniref:YfhO family protein n=1 Tax=Butyrivibrio sp. XPD2006 TaxID=1280668 RepID=UPI0003B6DA05|nr:YfhO family protein [Butyrivibrio sp. XPD2006]